MQIEITLPELDAILKLALMGLRQCDEQTTYQITPILAKARQAWIEQSEAAAKIETESAEA